MADAEETVFEETGLGLRNQVYSDSIQFQAWAIFRQKTWVPHHIGVRFCTFLCEEQNVKIELYKPFLCKNGLLYGQSLMSEVKPALCISV